jgi:hypothetical protein
VGREGEWFTWTYTTAALDQIGRHSVVFRATGEVSETADFECVPVARGLPREQYERTYVLLPPGAGRAWVVAVVDSVWDLYQYTIGGSADDAGIGNLDARRVIAVNPGEWPTSLGAFFAEHYPDVEVVSVTAETPDELAKKLERL